MNIPTIPDNINKILLIISLVLMYISYTETTKELEEYEKVRVSYREMLDSCDQFRIEVKFEGQKLLKYSENICFKYNTESLIIDQDSMLLFSRIYNSSKNNEIVREILFPKWEAYTEKNHLLDLKLLKLEKLRDNLLAKAKEYDLNETYLMYLGVIGFMLFGFSLFFIGLDYKNERNSKIRESLTKGKISSFCNSCLKLFDGIITHGTNRDGSVNYCFCKNCYDKGEFLTPDEEMRILVENDIKKSNLNWFLNYSLKNRLKRADRWNQNRYFDL